MIGGEVLLESFMINRRSMKLLLAGLVFLNAPLMAIAAPPAPADSSCDTSYYETLESRAWLEAEREITQNQNIISKPDSVLRYSCFDGALSHYESKASGMFSEGVDLSAALDAADDFVAGNFSDVHGKTIGGRASVSSGLDGNCSAMSQIWEDAQCANFADQPDSDAFFTLAEYVADADKRFEASCSKPSGWNDESEALKDANTPWTEDLVDTFSEELSADTSCSASKLIETGLTTLYTPLNATVDVKICLVQGCVYEPTSETTGDCKEYTP